MDFLVTEPWARIRRTVNKLLPLKRDYAYYSNNNYYDKLSSKYGRIEAYADLIAGTAKLESLESIVPIRPEFGESSETIRRSYGDPYYRLVNTIGLKNQIFFYKHILGGFKTKCEMHFFENKLFFHSYTFSYLSEADKTRIVEFLSQKYLGRSVSLSRCKIVDPSRNEISIQDSVDFVVNYLASTSDFFRAAEELRAKDREKREMREQLNLRELYTKL